MYDVSGKFLSNIISMYVDSLTYVRVKGGESECFRIRSGARQSYHVPMAFQYVYGCSNERNGKRKWRGGERLD